MTKKYNKQYGLPSRQARYEGHSDRFVWVAASKYKKGQPKFNLVRYEYI